MLFIFFTLLHASLQRVLLQRLTVKKRMALLYCDMADAVNCLCEATTNAVIILAKRPDLPPNNDEDLLLVVIHKTKTKRAKMNFCEAVVPSYTGDDFQSHFRLTRPSAEVTRVFI